MIDEKRRRLAENHRRGPARPVIAPEIRRFPVRRYPILYHVERHGIEVVHGMRDLQTHTSQRPPTTTDPKNGGAGGEATSPRVSSLVP